MAACPSVTPAGLCWPSQLRPARVVALTGWGGDHVNGVQLNYEAGGHDVRGPRRLGEHGTYRQATFQLDIAKGEEVVEVRVCAATLVDHFCVKTNLGREHSWGTKSESKAAVYTVPTGHTFAGFYGGSGGHLHYLGVVTVQRSDPKAAAETLQMSPLVAQLLYSGDAVQRAVALMLQHNGQEAVRQAVETAQKYLRNILGKPKEAKVKDIRLGNNFFDKHIGQLQGSTYLMTALGFQGAAPQVMPTVSAAIREDSAGPAVHFRFKDEELASVKNMMDVVLPDILERLC